MARTWAKLDHRATRKATSQGVGGRGRSVKCATSSMNKHKKRTFKKSNRGGR